MASSASSTDVYMSGRARLLNTRDPLAAHAADAVPSPPHAGRPTRRALGGTVNSSESSTTLGRSTSSPDDPTAPKGGFASSSSGLAFKEATTEAESGGPPDKGDREAQTKSKPSRGELPWNQRSVVYQWTPFRGMYYDVKRRLPYYWTDWTSGLHPRNIYRVAASCIRMYFVNLMPALSYLLDANRRTGGYYGVNEAVLTTAMPLLLFGILAAQPLTIVGFTGLTNLTVYTTYDIVTRDYGVNYGQFQGWMLLWAAIFHILAAVFNMCDYTRFITDMTSTTFGGYVGIIYIQKGIELLIAEFEHNATDGWLSCFVAVLFTVCVYWVEKAGRQPFGPPWLRRLLSDYGFVAGVVFFTGFVHIPGYLASANIEKLPITKAFAPTVDRNWIVEFWHLPVKWVFVAMPFGFLVTLLFYFDHNVSSLMAQARHFPVERPSGFHWDFFLLGINTFVSGLLGLPPANGLVPQAPAHTESLCVYKTVPSTVPDHDGIVTEEELRDQRDSDEERGLHKVVTARVVEQRLTSLIIGLMSIGTMTRPLLVALGLMPRAVFAGVFLVVGWASCEGNPILHKTLFLVRDPRMTPKDHPLRDVSRVAIAGFVAIQWLFMGATVAISQTIAAIGFPVIIIALIPVRYYLVPRWFSAQDLEKLDSPTANAETVLLSIGGTLSSTSSRKPSEAVERRRAKTESD